MYLYLQYCTLHLSKYERKLQVVRIKMKLFSLLRLIVMIYWDLVWEESATRLWTATQTFLRGIDLSKFIEYIYTVFVCTSTRTKREHTRVVCTELEEKPPLHREEPAGHHWSPTRWRSILNPLIFKWSFQNLSQWLTRLKSNLCRLQRDVNLLVYSPIKNTWSARFDRTRGVCSLFRRSGTTWTRGANWTHPMWSRLL